MQYHYISLNTEKIEIEPNNHLQLTFINLYECSISIKHIHFIEGIESDQKLFKQQGMFCFLKNNNDNQTNFLMRRNDLSIAS